MSGMRRWERRVFDGIDGGNDKWVSGIGGMAGWW